MMKLLENFWLKIIALIMGLLIWFHVATEKTYNYEVDLPVAQVDLKDSLTLAANPPDTVQVKVSATGKQLLRRQWREEGVRINASRYLVGRHRITLNTSNTFLISASSNVTLDDIVFPSQIELNIDRQGEVVLPVIPDVITIPDDGFAVNAPVEVTPPEVTLHGPSSLLDQYTTILTSSEELTGLRNNVALRLPLLKPPHYGMWLEPDSVTLSIDVVPVKTRVFENLPVVVFNVPPGHTATTEPPTVTVELTGAPDEIDALDRTAITVSADFRQVDQNGDAPVKVDHPPDFKVRKTSTKSVKIIIESNADSGN